MDALFASVDHKHSEAVADGGDHHKLGHPKISVLLGNTNSGKSGGYGSSGGGSKSGHPGNPAGPLHHHDESSTHGPGSAGPKTGDHDNGKNPIHVPEKSGNPVIGTPDTHHPDVNNGNREVRNGPPLIGTPVTHQPNGTPPGHGGLRPGLKPTPGHGGPIGGLPLNGPHGPHHLTNGTPGQYGGPKNGLPVIGGHHHGNYHEGIINSGHIVAGHHPEGMMRCARCSCIYTECQCGKSRQVGEAYCPNPNTTDVLKEFKTIVQIFRKIPEMKTVEKLTHKKKVITEERKFYFERDVIYYEDVERVDLIPVIKEVPRTIKEFVYEIITTEVEVPYTELVVDYREDCIIDETPIFKTIQVPETISVPVVIDKEVTRMCEEPTGQWCEVPVEDFCTRGDFNLICDDEAHDHSSSSDSSDSDSSHAHRHRHHTHTNGGRYNDSPKSATKSKNLKNRSEKEKTSGVKAALW